MREQHLGGVRLALAALTGACAILLVVASAASASSDVGIGGSSLFVDGDTGANQVTVATTATTVTVTDTSGVFEGDTACTATATTVTCALDPADPPLPAAPRPLINRVSVFLNDGDDTFSSNAALETFAAGGVGNDGLSTVGQVDVQLTGGEGNDTLSADGGLSSFLSGDLGNDTLTAIGTFPAGLNGGEGNDVATGGAGDDSLNGGEGDDQLNGGDGDDDLSDGGFGIDPGGNDVLLGGNGTDEASYNREDPLSISLDGLPNDGAPSRGEVDNVDTEIVRGGSENDTLTGNNAGNTLIGRDGNDTLSGLAGVDSLRGRNGDDALVGGLDRDDLECNAGLDLAVSDASDLVFADCERRGARIASESAVVKGKKTKVAVQCPLEETVPCTGTVTLVSNGRVLGSGAMNVAAGATATSKVKLSKKGLKALTAAGNNLLVTAQAQTVEPLGTSVSEERILLTVKPPKKDK